MNDFGKMDQSQILAMSNQINILTQQLALKQKMLEDAMKKPQILNQNDKKFLTRSLSFAIDIPTAIQNYLY